MRDGTGCVGGRSYRGGRRCIRGWKSLANGEYMRDGTGRVMAGAFVAIDAAFVVNSAAVVSEK
jgi:hypothetical protein